MRFRFFVRRNRGVFAIIALAAVLLWVIICLFRIDSSTNEMIIEYMSGLGWNIEESPREITHLTVPEEFDAVYRTYNAIQKPSGFDLESFKGKKVVRYSYRVLNHKYSSETDVTAGIFVFENAIIAGDISSASPNGFMHAVTETDYIDEIQY